jgi:hypothetical protein
MPTSAIQEEIIGFIQKAENGVIRGMIWFYSALKKLTSTS